MGGNNGGLHVSLEGGVQDGWEAAARIGIVGGGKRTHSTEASGGVGAHLSKRKRKGRREEGWVRLDDKGTGESMWFNTVSLSSFPSSSLTLSHPLSLLYLDISVRQ